MPLVQTTIFQNPIDVPDDEVLTLRQQGLLVEPDEAAEVQDQGADASADAKDDKTAGDGAKESK